MALILICLLALQVLADKPSLKAAINNPMLSLLKEVSIKKISDGLKDMPLPDFEADLKIARIFAKNITMHILPFNGPQVEMELIEGTSDFLLKGYNMSLNGSMLLTVKILFITANAKATMMASNCSFVARVSLLQNKTRLAVNVSSVQLTLDKNLISIKIVGDIIGDIMNAIANFLKTYFFQNIMQAMGQVLPVMISDSINEVLGALPDDVVVLPGMSLKFAFTSPPVVFSGYLLASLLLYAHQTNILDPPPYQPPELPDLNQTCYKGIQLFLSDYVVRSLVETSHAVGLMKFSKTVKALGFTINILCSTNNTPSVVFNGSIGLDALAYCNAEFKMKDYKFNIGFLIGLSALLTEKVEKSTIYFSVLRGVITSLKILFGKEIDAKALLAILNIFLEEVRKNINEELGKKGIPIPAFKMFDISEVGLDLVGHYIAMCGTLKPKACYYDLFPERRPLFLD